MFPSIIYEGIKKTKICDEVINDIKLYELFISFLSLEQSKSIVEILKNPPNKNDISKRQEIFVSLNNSMVYNFFSEILNKLKELKKQYILFNESTNQIYKKYNYYLLLDLYIKFVNFASDKSILNLCNSYFLKNFINCFSNLNNSEIFLECKNDLYFLQIALSEINDINLNIQLSNYIIQDYNLIQINDNNSLYNEFSNILKELEIPKKEKFYNKNINSYILESITKLFPSNFNLLNNFYKNFCSIFDETLFDYIIQFDFYIKFHFIFNELTKKNIPITMPEISKEKKVIISDLYDITLINQDFIIPNDIIFTEYEHIFILTGANGGGKTTFIRSYAISIIFFLNGLYVPCKNAVIYPFKNLFTNFSKNESLNMSRLEDEQKRIEQIILNADDETIILLNESFAGTNELKSQNLSIDLLKKISILKSFTIFVTHNHNLYYEAKKEIDNIFHLQAYVMQDSDNTRTFKIKKAYNDKNSYSYSILKKHGLTKEQLIEKFLGENYET